MLGRQSFALGEYQQTLVDRPALTAALPNLSCHRRPRECSFTGSTGWGSQTPQCRCGAGRRAGCRCSCRDTRHIPTAHSDSPSQAAISVSCRPFDVSSSRTRIARRGFVINGSPRPGHNLPSEARMCSFDMNSVTSSALKTHVSTTCAPWVLTICIASPALSRTARPLRAGRLKSSGMSAMARSPDAW